MRPTLIALLFSAVSVTAINPRAASGNFNLDSRGELEARSCKCVHDVCVCGRASEALSSELETRACQCSHDICVCPGDGGKARDLGERACKCVHDICVC